MSWMCEEVKQRVAIEMDTLLGTHMVGAVAKTRLLFEAETVQKLRQFIKLLPTSIVPIANFVLEIFHFNLLPTAFNTDWLLEYGDESNGFLIQSIPRVFTNSTCNCMISRKCKEPLRVGPPNLFLPGLVVGCSPIDGLRMSTLECFFSSDCISTILTYLEYYIQINGSLPIDFVPPIKLSLDVSPLNDSIDSRFSKNTLISTILDEMFIEGWTTNISYENYFATCSVASCTYEYRGYNSLLYVFTSVLGLYGGLTIGLRFFIWYGVRFYRLIKERLHFGRVAAQW